MDFSREKEVEITKLQLIIKNLTLEYKVDHLTIRNIAIQSCVDAIYYSGVEDLNFKNSQFIEIVWPEIRARYEKRKNG
jgi:hypothetical protein